jgi:replicative DNA helicase
MADSTEATKELLDLAPPHNEAIERELIGSLFHPEGKDAIDQLDPEDFYAEVNRFIFEEIKAASIAKVPIDSEGAVIEWMRKRKTVGRMKTLFGESWAWQLTLGMERCMPRNVPFYCRTLRDLRKRRAARDFAIRSLVGATKDSVDPARWRKHVGELLAEIDSIKDL